MHPEQPFLPPEHENRSLEPDRLARLEKQESAVPSALTVSDREMIRLLAIAGAGGSY